MAKSGEVVRAQECENLRQGRSLRPGTTAMNVDVPELRLDRRLKADTVFSQVIHRKEAAILAVEVRDQASDVTARSEEHTSELQSLMRNSYAVFCLKKKNHKRNKK